MSLVARNRNQETETDDGGELFDSKEPEPETAARTIHDLYQEIQREIRGYRRELRADLERLVKCAQSGPVFEGDQEHAPGGEIADGQRFQHLSNEVIGNLRNQLDIVWQEKTTFESLWKSSQKTIQILELEIGEYRKQLKQPKSIQTLRAQYTAALELLEQNLLACRTKLGQQLAENKRLKGETAAEHDRLEALERDFAALQSEHQQLQSELNECRAVESRQAAELQTAMKDKSELEALLDQANFLARQHMGRENQALAKVQEALQIADTAIEEKHSLLAREQDVREECNFLASTIGQVMEEAARKVELEMNSLRMGYENRITALEKQLEQLKGSLELQVQRTGQAESRATALEDKFKNLIVTNQNLDADLHAASKLIIEMELKLEAFQKTMTKEQEIGKMRQAREQELRQLLDCNEQLKERWRTEMLTVTDGLQRKIEALRRENCLLTVENNQLKDQLLREDGAGSVVGGLLRPSRDGNPIKGPETTAANSTPPSPAH
ncbi:myosin heavy chain, clone 203-like [Uranotaenia lowii]|uniref:myosin heavy chain, clone 203-like n=1 Tax=Uranotaenia lowii TaxID=190385 RepID=UPI00247A5ECC|nr:myosin heavy chain, clone 203-like [Uranotaenia lowii]